MRFRILGPLSVEVAGAPLRIRSARVATLLATLLLEANRTVPTERLVEAVWGWHAPTTARAQLRIVVSQLRRLLAGAGVERPVVFTETAGYRLAATSHELDVLLFEQYVAEAERAASAGRAAEAVGWFRSALELWRGPALAGVPGQLVGTAGTLLTERRAAVRARCIELELALGRHADLVTELVGLATADPFNERFRENLVLALYRSGRVTEALAAYQDFRQRLADEVGIEPGPRLAALHRRILNRDPALDLPATTPDASGAAAPPPPAPDAQPAPLPEPGNRSPHPGGASPEPANRSSHPAPSPELTGTRADPGDPWAPAGEPAGIEPNRPGRRPGGPARRRMTGRPARRTDGTPGRRPGRQPGGPARRRPSGRDGVSGQPAPCTGDTSGPAGTLPPRPASPTATPPVAATHASTPTATGAPADGQPDGCLYAKLVDEQGVPVDPYEVFGAFLRALGVPESAVPVGRTEGRDHYRPVAAGRRILVLLDGAVDEAQVRPLSPTGPATLATTYQRLAAHPATLLRRLGTLPVVEFPGWLAGPLLDADRSTAEQALAKLVDAGMLHPVPDRSTGLPRYRMPEPIRRYARERVGVDDPPPTRATAHRRAYWCLLDLALRADRQVPDQVFPAGALGLPEGFGPDDELLRAVDADPLGWLATERHLVVGAAEHAAGLGDIELAWRLAVAPTNFLHQRGLTELWQRAIEHGRAALRGRGPADRAHALLSLSNALLLLSRAESAAAWTAARTARRLFDELGDPDRAAACATVQWLAGQRPAANPAGERARTRRGAEEPAALRKTGRTGTDESAALWKTGRTGTDDSAPQRRTGTLRGVIRRIGVAPRATPILCPAEQPESPPRRPAGGIPAPRRASAQRPQEVVVVIPGQAAHPPDPARCRGE